MTDLKILLVASALAIGIATATSAQGYDMGVAAYQRGDYSAAIAQWLPLAEDGNGNAQYALGMMYKLGLGVPQDYTEAAHWLLLAAEQGQPDAQYNLSILYRLGQGVPMDFAEALRWNILAAEQGQPDAQFNIGVMYYKGEGVPQDFIISHMWLNLAAASGKQSAISGRDLVSNDMTADQIAEAQSLARECLAQDYKNCGR